MRASLRSTIVLIPALNAARSLPSLVAGLADYVQREQIVIVDDGSTDGTAAVANREHTILLRHDVNRGKGAALETGFRFVRSQPQMESILTIDADLQHLPSDIPALFRRQEETDADIVVGSRKRWGTGMPPARILSNVLTSTLVSIRTGQAISDSQCGFRLIRRAVLMHVSLQSSGFEAETEFLIKAAQQRFRIASAPIHTVYGAERSYMTHVTTTKNFLKTLLQQY